ncbi:MAG: LamG domain-containing protein [Planctomycetes bacterium]|nr:LamG domain-containing protein [Planctomycetota bacterium]
MIRSPVRSRVALVLVCAGTAPLVAQATGIQLTNGVDGGVVYQYDARFVPPTGITVEAWITYDDSTIPTGTYRWPTIARQNVTPNQESWNFRVSAANNGNRDLQFIVRTLSNALYNATYTFAPGEFQSFTHVAGTFDGQTIRIFKNGVQVATNAIPTASEIPDNGGELRIGNGDPVAPGNEAWNGVLDEVRIWPMARSGAEITATMSSQLWFMPGGVLEFDFENQYNEFSNNLMGTPFGAVNFAAGAPGLTIEAPSVAVVGQPTSTCARTSEIALGSMPIIGNSAFALWNVRGPTPAVSGLGLFVTAYLPAPAQQPAVFGVNLAFDLSAVVASFPLVPASNVLGNSTFALPLPNNPSISGTTLLFQFGFQDSQCGPQGFSAGSGLSVTIQ